MLEQALKNQVGAAREKLGRSTSSAFLIVDAQGVKNSDTAALKGYDAGKKIGGIKRHIAADTQGLPHVIAVTTAEVLEKNGRLWKNCDMRIYISLQFVHLAFLALLLRRS